jgi:hypothetical protein
MVDSGGWSEFVVRMAHRIWFATNHQPQSTIQDQPDKYRAGIMIVTSGALRLTAQSFVNNRDPWTPVFRPARWTSSNDCQ